MRKKHILLPLIALTLLPLSSCIVKEEPGTNDNDKTYVEKTYDFKSFSSSHTVADSKLNAYTFEGDGATYVEVGSFMDAINGYLDRSKITFKIDTSKNNDYLRMYVVYNNRYQISCYFYWNDNTISLGKSFLPLVGKSSETTRSSHLSVESTYTSSWSTSTRASYTYNLGDYDMDILYCNGKVLVPLEVMNIIFCSRNYKQVYFNGKGFYLVDSYISTSNPEQYVEIMVNSLNDTTPTQELRTYNYNFMCFAFDYFYGLQSYNNYDSNIDEYLSKKGYKTGMLSTDPKTYAKSYLNFFRKDLDEGHTAMATNSYYSLNAMAEVISEEGGVSAFTGEFLTKYTEQLTGLAQAKAAAYSDGSVPAVRYINDDTAVLHFDAFTIATNEQMKSETPWLYDTYEFFDHYLGEIVTKGCKNVIIDLSTNGGGTVSTMLESLGFLTDKAIPFVSQYKEDYAYTETYYNVEISNQAYRKLNYSILTSLCSYSAANLFAYTFKNMGLGKVYGTKSGGGMCAIFPTVLPDGSTLVMSGPTILQTIDENYHHQDVESGVTVDAEFDSYSYYYDDAYLAENVKFAQIN